MKHETRCEKIKRSLHPLKHGYKDKHAYLQAYTRTAALLSLYLNIE